MCILNRVECSQKSFSFDFGFQYRISILYLYLSISLFLYRNGVSTRRLLNGN